MAENTKPKTAAEITPEMIAAWKAAQPKGVVFELVIEDKKGYLRKPNRNDMKYALTAMGAGGELAMVEAVLEEIWLGGDEEILNDDDYFLAATMQVKDLLNVKDGQLKKL